MKFNIFIILTELECMMLWLWYDMQCILNIIFWEKKILWLH